MTGSDRFSLWVLNFQFMAHRFGSGELFVYPPLKFAMRISCIGCTVYTLQPCGDSLPPMPIYLIIGLYLVEQFRGICVKRAKTAISATCCNPLIAYHFSGLVMWHEKPATMGGYIRSISLFSLAVYFRLIARSLSGFSAL